LVDLIAAAFATLAIGALTISFQAIKGAVANPVKTLNNEALKRHGQANIMINGKRRRPDLSLIDMDHDTSGSINREKRSLRLISLAMSHET
jgi:hypothetical protein